MSYPAKPVEPLPPLEFATVDDMALLWADIDALKTKLRRLDTLLDGDMLRKLSELKYGENN
jgi:hypothetical protein